MTMLTYESLWLENDQLLKVQLFLENIGVSNYVISRIEEEGVSTITVPEISEENWNKVEDFEYTLLMGIFGQTKKQAQDKIVCISCNAPIYIQRDSQAKGPGHIYSQAWENEYSTSDLCEYCFYKAFDDTIAPGEREIEELESFTTNHQ